MKKLIMSLIVITAMTACESGQKDTNLANNAIKVEVKTPVSPEGPGRFSASGTVEAENFASLSTRTMGYVSKVYVTVGDKVSKNQLLLDINSEEIDAKKAQANAGLSQAAAQLKIAEKDYQRYEKLYQDKSASQKEFDDMTARYTMAKAGYESALQMQNEIDAMMAYSHIRAPFSGVITSKSIKMGDLAKPGQPLLSLEAPGSFVAAVMIPEIYIESITKGQEVDVYIKSSQKSVKGTVSEVSSSSLNSGGQYMVKLDLKNDANQKLFSGMYVTSLFPVESLQGENLLIDRNALVQKGELDGIYTVSASGTAILRWLKIGKESGDQVEVLSGLKPEEQYIVSNEGKLYNGVKIVIQ